MIEHCPSGLCRHTFGCSRLPGPPPSLSFGCYGLFQSRDMFVDKTIQRERSRALNYHYQSQCDRQQMVLNPVSLLVSEPVQKEAESEMNSCNSTHHREHDDYCGNSAE